jgi:hypothetical protein
VYRADVPPTSLTDETDAFGHRDYAEAIAVAAATAEPPFTLGLFGPWGVGKTTILEETGRRLPAKCAFAMFDAWRYERDALRRQFISEISRQLIEKEQLEGYDREAALEELTTPVSSVRPAGLTVRWENALRAALSALLVAVVVFLGLKLGFTAEKSAIGSVIAAITTFAVLLIGAVGQVIDIKYETLTRPRLEDPERFTEKFEDLLAHLKPERLVVAIDNLDRCTPERVEELFDTLNTYLEPAGAADRAQGLSRLLRRKRREGRKKEAVFIVAADDEALRRHLEARERQASGGRGDGTGSYAAEYLRKIFKASIPIKPLLDTDMRTYVEMELERFFEAHPLESVDRARLVELIAAALKQNPRRVRQFVNNLELRLELLNARESGSKAIAAALSREVLTVAKLTLLEEEWPESYTRVARDPRILDEWHTKQTTGDLATVPAADLRDPSFAAFLNASRAIRSPYLPAFISLKQSREELRLPRYTEFREALVLGDAERLADVLKDADEATAHDYSTQLLAIFRHEASRGYVDAARSVVEGAISERRLAEHEATVDELLTEAAREPSVRAELRQTDPRPILSAAQRLPAEDFALVLEPFLDLVGFKSEGSERFDQVIDALTIVTARLSEQAKQRIRTAIASDEISESFGEYLPLIESHPGLLPDEAGAKALEALAADVDVASPAFGVVVAWFERGTSADQQDRFVSLVGQRLASLAQSGEITEESREGAERLVAVASALTDITESAAMSVISNVERTFASNTAGPLAPAMLDLAGALAATQQDGRSLVVPLVTSLSSNRPDDLISYSLERGETLPPPLKGAMLPQLGQLAHTLDPFERKDRAAQAIVRVMPNDETGDLAAAVTQCVARDDFSSVEGFIARYRVVLEPAIQQLVAGLLERARQLGPANNSQALRPLLTLADSMSEEQRGELRELIRDALLNLATSGSIDQLRPVLERAGEHAAFQSSYALLTKEVWDAVKGQGDPPLILIEFVVENFNRLDPDRRAAFVTQFGNWFIQSPHLRQPLSQFAARIEDLKSTERQQLVETLIEGERLESDPNAREPLLRAAQVIAGASRATGAKRRLQERLDALKDGSEPDQEVRRRLIES